MAPMQRCMRYSAGVLCAAGLARASVFGAGPASAHTAARSGPATSARAPAAAGLPVNYSFATGYAENFAAPAVSPPGANNWSCRRTAAHPYPGRSRARDIREHERQLAGRVTDSR